MLAFMLLIATALAEELQTALNLCSHRKKIRLGGVPIWTGVRAGATLHLLKLGIGPARSAVTLERALANLKATSILIIGYAGALDPELKLGELVVVERAHLLAEEPRNIPLGEINLDSSWELAGAERLFTLARGAGLAVRRSTVLTSPSVIGVPEQKRFLFQRFGTAIVDMETAALARVASTSAVPLSCVRAVSDEADDDFLAMLAYEPARGSLRTVAKMLAAGGWLHRYNQWRERSLAARQSLSQFLTCYLDRKTVTNDE
jgi:adenosylhomocysteine nucleosidase